MRLYPPAALIVRAARRDVVLDNEQIRAGTAVYVAVYAVHRHEKLWSEPDRFDPSRFEPEVAKEIDRFSTCLSAQDHERASDRTSLRWRPRQSWPRFFAASGSNFGQAIHPSPGCA